MSKSPNTPPQGMNVLQHAALMTVRRAWAPLSEIAWPGTRYVMLVDIMRAADRGLICMLAPHAKDEDILSVSNRVIEGKETRPHILVSVLKGGQAVIEHRGDWSGFKGAVVPDVSALRLDEKKPATLVPFYQKLMESALRVLHNDFPMKAAEIYKRAARANEEQERRTLIEYQRSRIANMTTSGTAFARATGVWHVSVGTVTFGAVALAALKNKLEPK